MTSVLCLHYRPETVHCSTKDVYTSEKTFLALHPWLEYSLLNLSFLKNLEKVMIYVHCTEQAGTLETVEFGTMFNR